MGHRWENLIFVPFPFIIIEARLIKKAKPELRNLLASLKDKVDALQKENCKLQRVNDTLIHTQSEIRMLLTAHQEIEGETQLARDISEFLNHGHLEEDVG